MTRLLSVKNLFSLFLIIWFAYGVWEARSYSFLAKIFPFYISLVLVVCAVISIIMEIRKVVDEAEDLRTEVGSSDLAGKWDIPMADVWRRFGRYLGYIVCLYLLIYLIGYPLSLTIFIFIFYRFIAKSSWFAAIAAGLAGLGFLSLASKVLGMDWPMGLIKLPWPLG